MLAKHRLSLLIKLMFAILIAAFAWVLFASLSTSNNSSALFSDLTLFSDLRSGETTLKRYNKQRVWVTKISSQQQRYYQQLTSHVSAPNNNACAQNVTLCVISAATDRDGIELVYSVESPPQLSDDIPWHGGFIDPNNSAAYDLFGRAYLINKLAKPLTIISIEAPE